MKMRKKKLGGYKPDSDKDFDVLASLRPRLGRVDGVHRPDWPLRVRERALVVLKVKKTSSKQSFSVDFDFLTESSVSVSSPSLKMIGRQTVGPKAARFRQKK